MNRSRFAIAVIALCLISAAPAHGEFINIVNVPPDAIAADATFGSNTQVNFLHGGTTNVGNVLRLGDGNAPVKNTQLNALGGSLWAVDAWNGSQLNVAAGSIGVANLLGGNGTMSGGIADYWSLFAASHLEMSGGFAAHIDVLGTTTGSPPDAATFVMTGGLVRLLDATGNATIRGGTVDRFVFRGGGFVDISGGSIGDDFEVGGVVTGALPDDPTREIVVGTGGHVTVSGGSIGQRMILRDGRTLDYSGGAIGDSFRALEGSRVNIYGSRFLLNGVDLTWPAGEELLITQRNVALEGLLADGTPFRFDLNSEPGHGDFFSSAATIAVIAIPEPSTTAIVFVGTLAALGRRWFSFPRRK